MKRILFVDDEPRVLDGLRRMLRPLRREWHMSFAQSGREALEILAAEPCDVIVSDMRMPGMDGVALLGEVMRRHPGTVRIALSGHAEMEMLLESVRAAHQYLAKPCDTQTLKTTVERACALRELLTGGDLTAMIGRLDSLPSLPALYMEIMQELGTQEASINRVGQIIEQDLGMTAKILQVVNSAFFGLRRHVTCPSQAASLLGLDVIRSLVLTTQVFSQFDNLGAALELEALWSHSIQVGTLAKAIAAAQGVDGKSRDHSLMAGMLHDVGKLVLADQHPGRYASVVVVAGREGLEDWQAEQDEFGCTHMEIGAYLLGLWGLPNPIVEAVAFHHRPHTSAGLGFTPLSAVHVANVLLRHGGVAPGDGEATPLDRDYLERLGVQEQVPVWEGVFHEVLGTLPKAS